jgi:hypothetical protein
MIIDWSVGSNTSNSWGKNQVTYDWYNDLKNKTFFIEVRILKMESRVEGG